MEQVETMPLEQLGETVIMFGQAMKGRTFVDTVTNETEWVRWMLDNMATSPRMEHVAFMTYVRRYVEKAETTDSEATLHPDCSSKDLGATAAASKSRANVWDVISDKGADTARLQEQMALLGERLGQMENLMQQMLQRLSQSS